MCVPCWPGGDVAEAMTEAKSKGVPFGGILPESKVGRCRLTLSNPS